MSCPPNPPAPAGYSVWKGEVPTTLETWAVQLLKTVNKYDFGQTWQNTDPRNGQPVIARLDRHTWHYLPDGRLLTNLCWKGITLYRPIQIQQGQLGGVVENIETATPDESLAVYDTPPGNVDWILVAETAAVTVAIGTLFWLALKYAGKVH